MCISNPTPLLERLNELLIYNPETGIFTRKTGRGGIKSGSRAGWIHTNGQYRFIGIDSKDYPESRLAWKMAYGIDAEGVVHHGDAGSLCNAIWNLRDITPRENCSIEKTIKSGLPVGVGRSGKVFTVGIYLKAKAIT